MAQSSAHRVLLVTELLEMILLQLPMEDIILSQMVCTYWRDAIAGSRPLQRIACFVDARTEAIDTKLTEAAVSIAGGPTEAEFESRLIWPLGKILQSHRNPVSQKLGGWELMWTSAHYPTQRLVLVLHPNTIYPKLMRSEASWRKMLFTHPPLPWVYVIKEYGSSGPVKVQNENGVTLGEVMDSLAWN